MVNVFTISPSSARVQSKRDKKLIIPWITNKMFFFMFSSQNGRDKRKGFWVGWEKKLIVLIFAVGENDIRLLLCKHFVWNVLNASHTYIVPMSMVTLMTVVLSSHEKNKCLSNFVLTNMQN